LKTRAGLLWLSIPLIVYAAVLARLCFNAPVSDDYDTILYDVFGMMNTTNVSDWVTIATMQHNEHRIAVTHVLSWALETYAPPLDFRVITAIGNLSVVAICVLMWAQFRSVVAAPLFLGAGLLMCQASYFEASLMPSAALPNIGVVAFSLLSLWFATRGRAWGAAACIALALLAMQSQGNGLFALPIAAAACLLEGRRSRALVFLGVAAVTWAAYFHGYYHPPQHPSPLVALHEPVMAVRLFVMMIGAILPGIWLPTCVGVAIVAALALLAWRGAWRAFPFAALCVVFVMASLAAATLARVGFGLALASRYATYSSVLVTILFLAFCSTRREWSRAQLVGVTLACAAVSLTVSWKSWEGATSFARAGRLVFKVVPGAPEVQYPRYVGMLYPNMSHAYNVLAEAERRGIYVPREVHMFPTVVRSIASIPPGARSGGYLDHVIVSGRVITADGWTDLPPLAAGRTLSVYSAGSKPRPLQYPALLRTDAAMFSHVPDNLFGGFSMYIDYPTEVEASAAAESLCVVAEIPGRQAAVLPRTNGRCQPR
jgi:hypothetical protein